MDINLNPDMNEDDRENLEKMKKIFEQESKSSSDVQEKLLKEAEMKLQSFMFEVGDFDARHYCVKKYNDIQDEGGNYRLDLYLSYEYVGTDKQKKKALKILKTMYGKNFKTMVMDLHPKIQLLMGDEEFGKMITDEDIMNVFRR